jgi:hypothetical protein
MTRITNIPVVWMIVIVVYWLMVVANLAVVFYNKDIRLHDGKVKRMHPRCPNLIITLSKIVFAITWPLPLCYGLYVLIFHSRKPYND